MTTLVTADWHLNDNPRDAYRHAAMKTLRRMASEHKVSRTIILGDLTDEKDRHSSELVNDVVEHLYQLSKMCPVIVLRGNHDYVVADDPFFGFVGHLPDVLWINNPTKITFEDLGQCLFLPHTRNYKKDWTGVSLEGHDWVFAHNTFDGACTEHGRELRGIPRDIFPFLRDYVISGDVHVPQQLKPINYVGAPYTIDFGDDYTPRVLLLTGDSATSVPVPGAQKRLIDEKGTPHVNPGDIVKARVGIKAEQYADWPTIRQEWKDWAEGRKVILYSIHPVVEQKQTSVKKQIRDMAKSDEQILRSYAKGQQLDDSTIKTGLKLLAKG